VQYLKIDRDAIAAVVGIPNLERKARTYFDEHQQTDRAFRRDPELVGKPDPLEAAGLLGPPAPNGPVLEWDEAREAAMVAVRKQTADETADRIAVWAIQYAAENWSDAVPQRSGYKLAPPDVATPDFYAKLVERLPQSMVFPNAVTQRTTDFFTEKDAAKVPEIGGAVIRMERGLIARTFRDLAFRNQAIIPTVPTGEGVSAADYLAMFQTSALPLTDLASGNLFVFRVIDSRPGRPAESIAEVREQVIADLRLLRGFEAAKARAESLRGCLVGESLKEAYDADPDLPKFRETVAGTDVGYFEPPPFSRVPRGQVAQGRLPNGVIVGGGVGLLPNAVVDTCFALENAAEKAKVVELPDRAAVMLAEWVETKRAAEDEFSAQRKMLLQQLSDARWRAAVTDWLDPARIRSRNGFALLSR